MITPNTIYNEDCLITMRDRILPNSIDLIVTSPPYDNLRTYDTLPFEKFQQVAKAMASILKDGGVIVWVIGDQVIDGSETGTSFRQALYFKDECNLKLYDTMIYEKQPRAANRER